MGIPYRDEEAVARRRYVIALVFSLIVIVAGMAWTWQVGKKANLIAHRLYHAREGLDDLKQYLGKREAHAP